MKQMLITGGTVFVSRFAAEYFLQKGWKVCVLNRNTREQVPGVTLIQADRHNLGEILKEYRFDAVLDITAYDAQDVSDLLDGLGSFDDYILISSSAVYPETEAQPFSAHTPVGANRWWGSYGTNKIEAEKLLLERVPHAYILRPPYIYGPMNNVYREAFVFDCAMADRPFYLPGGGALPLQFFHIRDLCRFMEILLSDHPSRNVFNVGNPETVTAKEWVSLCYQAAGRTPEFRSVSPDVEQRRYFPFYEYAYALDVSPQSVLMPDITPLEEGLREACNWYCGHSGEVNKKPLLEFIDRSLGADS